MTYNVSSGTLSLYTTYLPGHIGLVNTALALVWS